MNTLYPNYSELPKKDVRISQRSSREVAMVTDFIESYIMDMLSSMSYIIKLIIGVVGVALAVGGAVMYYLNFAEELDNSNPLRPSSVGIDTSKLIPIPDEALILISFVGCMISGLTGFSLVPMGCYALLGAVMIVGGMTKPCKLWIHVALGALIIVFGMLKIPFVNNMVASMVPMLMYPFKFVSVVFVAGILANKFLYVPKMCNDEQAKPEKAAEPEKVAQ